MTSSAKAAVDFKEEFVLVRPIIKSGYSSLPKDQIDRTVRISSTFKSINSRGPIKGLNEDQEFLFMSQFVSIGPDNPNFIKECEKYWEEHSIKIPEIGLKLNKASRQEKRTIRGKEVEVDIPYNLSDYITWKFIMENPFVAKTEDEKANLYLYSVIVEDLTEVMKQDTLKLQAGEEADKNYISLITSKNPEIKIDFLIEKFRNQYENFMFASLDEKKMKLREIKNDNPAQFNEAFTNPNLEHEALISQLIRFSIIEKQGDLFFFGLENLGTAKGSIEYFKDPSKSEMVLKIKELLNQAIKSMRNV